MTTDQQKARLQDLTINIIQLVRDENRDIDTVCQVLQIIKDRRDFAEVLGLPPTPATPAQLLRHLGTITVPLTDPFLVRERIVRDTGKDARVKISFVEDNFMSRFSDLVVPCHEATMLRYVELTTDSLDAPILAELGDMAETSLGTIDWLMEQQRNGEKGALLTNGYANIFYVKDTSGSLCAVRVLWGGGWYVDASEVSDQRRWSAGNRVFSRNS